MLNRVLISAWIHSLTRNHFRKTCQKCMSRLRGNQSLTMYTISTIGLKRLWLQRKKREMRWEKRKRFIINILRQIPNIIQILWLKYCLSSDFRNTLKLIYYYHQYSFNNCSSLCIYYDCHSVFITSNFSLRIKQIVME